MDAIINIGFLVGPLHKYVVELLLLLSLLHQEKILLAILLIHVLFERREIKVMRLAPFVARGHINLHRRRFVDGLMEIGRNDTNQMGLLEILLVWSDAGLPGDSGIARRADRVVRVFYENHFSVLQEVLADYKKLQASIYCA